MQDTTKAKRESADRVELEGSEKAMVEYYAVYVRKAPAGKKTYWNLLGYCKKGDEERYAQLYVEACQRTRKFEPILFVEASPISPSREYLEAAYRVATQDVAKTFDWSYN